MIDLSLNETYKEGSEITKETKKQESPFGDGVLSKG